jgi:hypothetical protein
MLIIIIKNLIRMAIPVILSLAETIDKIFIYSRLIWVRNVVLILSGARISLDQQKEVLS